MLDLVSLLFVVFFSPVSTLPATSNSPGSNLVDLRIEGLSNTIYEAPIFSGPRNITTASGGTHLCDGTNNGANLKPGNTPTSALDAASKRAKFPFDGNYFDQFEDFFITSIGSSRETTSQFWGLLVNYNFTPVGGCQFELKPGDQVLWAFDAFTPDASTFPAFKQKVALKVAPSTITAKKGQAKTVTVTDGLTGAPAQGALINGVTTDKNGKATLKFPKVGVFKIKATKSDAIRSNALSAVIT